MGSEPLGWKDPCLDLNPFSTDNTYVPPLSPSAVDRFFSSFHSSVPCGPDSSFQLPSPWKLQFPSDEISIPADLPESSISDAEVRTPVLSAISVNLNGVQSLYGNRLNSSENAVSVVVSA